MELADFSKLPEDYWEVITRYGFGEYAIDLSNVTLEDALALIEFMRKRKE